MNTTAKKSTPKTTTTKSKVKVSPVEIAAKDIYEHLIHLCETVTKDLKLRGYIYNQLVMNHQHSKLNKTTETWMYLYENKRGLRPKEFVNYNESFVCKGYTQSRDNVHNDISVDFESRLLEIKSKIKRTQVREKVIELFNR